MLIFLLILRAFFFIKYFWTRLSILFQGHDRNSRGKGYIVVVFKMLSTISCLPHYMCQIGLLNCMIYVMLWQVRVLIDIIPLLKPNLFQIWYLNFGELLEGLWTTSKVKVVEHSNAPQSYYHSTYIMESKVVIWSLSSIVKILSPS